MRDGNSAQRHHHAISLGSNEDSVRPCYGVGAPGAGGAMGYADPGTGIGYGYVTDRMGTQLEGDPRDVALRAVLER